MKGLLFDIEHQTITHLFLIMIIAFMFSSSLWARTDGWYVGAGVSAVSGQSSINSSGASENLFVVKPATPFNSNLFEMTVTNTATTQNNHLTGTFNTNFGFNGLLGYSISLKNKLGLALQADAALTPSLSNLYQQQVAINGGVLINHQPVNLFSRVKESYLRSYGVSILPQLHLFHVSKDDNTWQTSLLMLVGYRYGLFKSIWQTASPWTGINSFVTRTGRDGIEIGLGTQISLTNRLHLRFIASQTWYQKKSILRQAPNWMSQSKAQINQATLGLIGYI